MKEKWVGSVSKNYREHASAVKLIRKGKENGKRVKNVQYSENGKKV